MGSLEYPLVYPPPVALRGTPHRIVVGVVLSDGLGGGLLRCHLGLRGLNGLIKPLGDNLRISSEMTLKTELGNSLGGGHGALQIVYGRGKVIVPPLDGMPGVNGQKVGIDSSGCQTMP